MFCLQLINKTYVRTVVKVVNVVSAGLLSRTGDGVAEQAMVPGFGAGVDGLPVWQPERQCGAGDGKYNQKRSHWKKAASL